MDILVGMAQGNTDTTELLCLVGAETVPTFVRYGRQPADRGNHKRLHFGKEWMAQANDASRPIIQTVYQKRWKRIGMVELQVPRPTTVQQGTMTSLAKVSRRLRQP